MMPMQELTFFQIMKLSLVIPILLVLSVIMVAVFLERVIFYARMARVSPAYFKKIRDRVVAGDIAGARAAAGAERGLIAEAMEAILQAAPSRDRAQMDHMLTLHFQRTQSMLGRRLGLFGTLSFISPLLGLLGTVLGVMTAFRDLAVAGAGGPGVVAAGIAEALYATAAGIFVAVVAALIYNYFNFRMKHVLNSLNIFGQEIEWLALADRRE